MRGRHRLFVARDAYKFSVAHMTVFPDGSKERLHGHNYQLGLALELADVSFAHMVPFARLKEAMATLCAEWKERTLIAERNPFLTHVRRTADEAELVLCGRRYVLPAEDVLFLPIENVCVEQLAALLAEVLLERLGNQLDPAAVVGLEVTLEESPGQGASSYMELRKS